MRLACEAVTDSHEGGGMISGPVCIRKECFAEKSRNSPTKGRDDPLSLREGRQDAVFFGSYPPVTF